MARVITKIGDIFSVKIDENSQKYFQLIAFDLMQLNSDVVRTFKRIYPIDTIPDPVEIVGGEVEFYAHCVVNLGVKMGLWEKVGKTYDVGKLDHILFRDSKDYGSRPGEKFWVSRRWYIWRINDKNFTKVGMLEGVNRTAEIGIVVNPYDIVERIKTGEYSFFYPGFE